MFRCVEGILRLGKRTETESHATRMAKASQQKAVENLPELERVLTQMVKVLKDFVSAYGSLDRDSLLKAANVDCARALRQAMSAKASLKLSSAGGMAIPRRLLEDRPAAAAGGEAL